MKVNVIGLGYIGLPTALMLASHDVKVIGTDYNEELVATLNAEHFSEHLIMGSEKRGWFSPKIAHAYSVT